MYIVVSLLIQTHLHVYKPTKLTWREVVLIMKFISIRLLRKHGFPGLHLVLR